MNFWMICIFRYQNIDFLISENKTHIILRIIYVKKNRNFLLFSDIRKYIFCDIKKSVWIPDIKMIFWYQKIDFLISENWFFDIRKSNLWYLKMCYIFYINNVNFWYQKLYFLISENLTYFLISENDFLISENTSKISKRRLIQRHLSHNTVRHG